MSGKKKSNLIGYLGAEFIYSQVLKFYMICIPK